MTQNHAEHTTNSKIDNPDNGLAITDPNMQSVPKPPKSLPYNTFSQRQIDLAGMLLDGVEPRKAALACGYPIDNGKFAHLMGRSWIGPCKAWVAARRLADERRRMQDVLSGIASSEPGEVARLLAKPADEWTDSDMTALAGASAVEAVTTTYPDGRKVTRIKVKLADKIRAAQALDAIHRQDIQSASPGMPSPAPARMPIPTRRKVGAERRAKMKAERKPTKAAMRESVKLAENAAIAAISDPTIAASVRALLHRPNEATLDRLDPIAQAIQAGNAQVGSGEQPQAAPHAAHRAEEAKTGPPPTADQPAAGPGPMRVATGSFHFPKENKVQPPPMEGEEASSRMTSISSSGPIQHPSGLALREMVGSSDPVVIYKRNEELLGPIDRSICRGDVGVSGPILGFDRTLLTHGAEKKPVSLRELSRETKVTVPVVNAFTNLEDEAI